MYRYNLNGKQQTVPKYIQKYFALLSGNNFVEDFSDYVAPKEVDAASDDDEEEIDVVNDPLPISYVMRSPTSGELEEFKRGFIAHQKINFLRGVIANFEPDLSEYQPPTKVLKENHTDGWWLPGVTEVTPTLADLEAHRKAYIETQTRNFIYAELAKRNAAITEKLSHPSKRAKVTSPTTT